MATAGVGKKARRYLLRVAGRGGERAALRPPGRVHIKRARGRKQKTWPWLTKREGQRVDSRNRRMALSFLLYSLTMSFPLSSRPIFCFPSQPSSLCFHLLSRAGADQSVASVYDIML